MPFAVPGNVKLKLPIKNMNGIKKHERILKELK
jgi:hypothetical protein